VEKIGALDAQAIVSQQDGPVRTIPVPGASNAATVQAQVGVRTPRRHGRHLYLTANECFFTSTSGKLRCVPAARPVDLDPDPLNDGRYFQGMRGFRKIGDEVRWHFVTMAQRRPPARIDIEFFAPTLPVAKEKHVVGVKIYRCTAHNTQEFVAFLDVKLQAMRAGRLAASLHVEGLTRGYYVLALEPVIFTERTAALVLRRVCVRQRAKLFAVRARWRPEHEPLFFKCSALGVGGAKAWVISISKDGPGKVFAAMRTPFGYVGLLFDPDGRVTMPEGLNFSMWSQDRGAPDPPVHHMPHFLCIDNGKAKFGRFSHEGSGVKVRNGRWGTWSGNVCRTYTIALTMEEELDHVFADGRLYGFTVSVWDEAAEQFKRFAFGRHFSKKRLRNGLPLSGFLEVAGPPHRNRSGDAVRRVTVTGVAQDAATGAWHQIDCLKQVPGCAGVSALTYQPGPNLQGFERSIGGVVSTSNTDLLSNTWERVPAPTIDVEHALQDVLGDTESANESEDASGNESDDAGDPFCRVPSYASQLGSVWAPVAFPSIRSVVLKADGAKVFEVQLPASLGPDSINRVAIHAGPVDGASLTHLWTHSYSPPNTFSPGVHKITVPAEHVPKSCLVARVLVQNASTQVWSDDGFDL
jgi:hypothetical protein